MSISNHVVKHGTTIGTAKVISNDILPKGASIPGRLLTSVNYITIHNTGLVDVKSNNFHRSLKRENSTSGGRQASWSFTVDDIEIYQETKANWETWHAGNSTGNKTSISIETCMWSNKEQQRKTYENAAALTAMLLKYYGLGVDRVVQHNKWSNKNCPEYLRSGKHGYDWNYFISRVKAHYNGNASSGSGSTSSSAEKRVVGTIECLVDNLNIRKDADFDSPVVGTLKKRQVVSVMAIKNGLYKIKEGQWTSAGTKYVKFVEEKTDVYEVNTDSLNVRSNRGTEYSKVGSLKRGDRIAIWSIGKDKNGDNWGSFRYSFSPDVIGFVHMGYLKKI